MPARKLPPDNKLIEMYQTGLSIYEVADKIGVRGATVATKLKQLGVIRTHVETWNLPGRHKPLATKEWLHQKYTIEGLGMPEIGKILERDAKTIFYWLRKYGISTRPRGSDVRQQFKAGQSSIFTGHKHTPEAIERIKQASIDRGAIPYLKDGKHYNKGKRGNVVWNWKGGITPERETFYRSEEWKEAVKAVWKRDNAICQRCGLDYRTVDRKTSRKFHIHHIVSFMVKELRADPGNLVLLCHPCHMWVHSSKNVNKEFIIEPEQAF